MNSDEMFNWPDGDVILHAIHGTDSRDFRVHKIFLSFASPVFRDMFTTPQPSSTSNVDVVDVIDSPQTLELILRFIYPCPSPVINDLATLSEVLTLADKYGIEAARSRLRRSLVEFARAEPLRVYAICCRFGFEGEMKIASSHTTSIDLPDLTQLPDEFRFIPATEYRRLVHLHRMYRREVMLIATRPIPTELIQPGGAFSGLWDTRTSTLMPIHQQIVDCLTKGTPLDFVSFALALRRDYGVCNLEIGGIGNWIRSVLDRANTLNMTV